MNQQILFSSEDQSVMTFQNFYAAENSNVLSAMNLFLHELPGPGCFYLYGEPGSGKTHLLKSAISQVNQGAQYLDINQHIDQLTDISNTPDIKLLALDNIEEILNSETQMMLVYETLMQRSAKLLLASKFAPGALPLALRDLTSRFMSGQTFELKMLNDKQKAKALELRAGLRGFELSEEVIHYVINRYPRDFKTLFGLLDKFDDASLSKHRKITIPFIKNLEI